MSVIASTRERDGGLRLIAAGMDLAAWVLARRTVPTIEEIRDRTGCSRSQAYRYRIEIVSFLIRHGRSE